MSKEHMMEAMKRKRSMIKQYEEDSTGEHAEGQSAEKGNEELAPARGSSEVDALKGHPPAHPYLKDDRPKDLQNETKLGREGGFKEYKGSAPENSKNLFHDPKEDTHDPADLNRHRNMAGDGSNSKYDTMGVDVHTEPRHQSSKLAGKNARQMEKAKEHERSFVKSNMDIASKDASSDGHAGMDAEDAVHHNSQQKGFSAPFSKVNKSGSKTQSWDDDEDGAENKGGMYAEAGNDGDGDEEGNKMKPRMSGFKAARAKLDGFLSKKKQA